MANFSGKSVYRSVYYKRLSDAKGSCTVFFCPLIEAYRIVFPVIVALEEGDTCTAYSGGSGTCVDIRDCAHTRLTFRHEPHVRCGFKGIFPVVCCPENQLVQGKCMKIYNAWQGWRVKLRRKERG